MEILRRAIRIISFGVLGSERADGISRRARETRREQPNATRPVSDHNRIHRGQAEIHQHMTRLNRPF